MIEVAKSIDGKHTGILISTNMLLSLIGTPEIEIEVLFAIAKLRINTDKMQMSLTDEIIAAIFDDNDNLVCFRRGDPPNMRNNWNTIKKRYQLE